MTDPYLVVSVDDHMVEPPDIFERRLPRTLLPEAPRVVRTDDGRDVWMLKGEQLASAALNAVVGLAEDDWTHEPARFDSIRRGCWDVDYRIEDMNTDGVWASVNFPSAVAGFCGAQFWGMKDQGLGLALTRAWNDWHLEDWAMAHPDRIIPMQIAWMTDVELGAKEILSNAERGFRAVSFCEGPSKLGLPGMASGHWDPILAACQETETVVCLHVGSSGKKSTPKAPPGTPPLEYRATLFAVSALTSATEWLWSGVPVRFPELRIALSEGGIGWVPMMLDRLDYLSDHALRKSDVWMSKELAPSEVVRRNFWFCTLDDPSAMALRHRIGVDHIMIESDYPHSDSTWPDTQGSLARLLEGLPQGEADLITHQNASKLFRHPLPEMANK